MTAMNTPKYTTPGTPRPVDAMTMMKPIAIKDMKNRMKGERCLRRSEYQAAATATTAAVM